MSSSNTTNDILITLNAIYTRTQLFNQYWSIIMIIVGFIGHTFNVIIYTRSTLWSNPCIRYLFASAIAGYLIIFFALPLRMLQFGYGINVFVRAIFLCKFITYILSCFRILPCWFIALANFDRFLCSSTSTKLRSWSSTRVSKYLIGIATIIVGLTQLPLAIFSEINPVAKLCGGSSIFQKFNAIGILFVYSIVPSAAMLAFGLLTVSHVRQSSRRLQTQNNVNEGQRRIKSVDRQLIQLTLIQSVLFGLVSAVGACGGIFNIIDDGTAKDPVTLATQQFYASLLSNIGLFTSCTSFYLCTLTSGLFRRELSTLFRLQRRQNQVHAAVNGGGSTMATN